MFYEKAKLFFIFLFKSINNQIRQYIQEAKENFLRCKLLQSRKRKAGESGCSMLERLTERQIEVERRCSCKDCFRSKTIHHCLESIRKKPNERVCGGRSCRVTRFHIVFKLFSHDFIKIAFGKFPDLLLFQFSIQPISSFSPDIGIDD